MNDLLLFVYHNYSINHFHGIVNLCKVSSIFLGMQHPYIIGKPVDRGHSSRASAKTRDALKVVPL